MSEEIIVNGLIEAVEFIGGLDKQATYAASLAINNTAKKIQQVEYDLSNKVFTIRKTWNKPNTKYGINRTYANKNNLNASVFSQAPWLDQQEYGGTKTKDRNRFSPVLVPNKDIQQTKTRLVPKRLALSTIKKDPAKSGAFMIGGNWWYRKNKKTIVPLFFHESSVSIKARYPFTETGWAVVNDIYQDEYVKAFEYAISTAF